MRPDARPLHPSGNLLRHLRINHGDPDATADVVVDRRVRGGHAGPGVPRSRIGRWRSRAPTAAWSCTWRRSGCTPTATRWRRASACRPRPCISSSAASAARSAGARTSDAGARVHARPAHHARRSSMVYGREESFFGHVHRHPCRMRYEHGATRDGRLVTFVRATRPGRWRVRVELHRRVRERRLLRRRPVRLENARLDAVRGRTRTTRRAERCAGSARCRSPSVTRRRWIAWRRPWTSIPSSCGSRNAMRPGSRMPTGQLIPEPGARGRAPGASAQTPLPPRIRPARSRTSASVREASATRRTARASGAAWATRSASRTSASRRASTTTRPRASGWRWTTTGRWSRCTPPPSRSVRGSRRSRPRSPGRSWTSIASRAARRHTVGSAGSSSASRQTYVTGGAVKAACEAVRDRLLLLAAERGPAPDPGATLEVGELDRRDDRVAPRSDLPPRWRRPG